MCKQIVFNVRNNFPRFELGIFMYLICNSMNNLSSYCGLVDVKIRASDKDLHVQFKYTSDFFIFRRDVLAFELLGWMKSSVDDHESCSRGPMNSFDVIRINQNCPK